LGHKNEAQFMKSGAKDSGAGASVYELIEFKKF